MTELEMWLKQATRHLSKRAAARVRSEIEEHYELARGAAMSNGAAAEEAARLAVAALGDARVANAQYREVLLTSSEARMLREAEWEGRLVCSRPRLKQLLAAIPVTALLAAAVCFVAGAIDAARILLVGGIGMGLLFAAPFLPVYTPARGRVFRVVKWVLLAGMLVIAFGPDTLKWFWLLASSLWPMAWIEWKRVSIRRKLRVADWPRHLYL
jgi:hypothetical protein